MARPEAERYSTRSWCRVDLGGGTLDIWPLGLLHPGARTVNVAISIAVEVEMARRARGYSIVQGDLRVESATAAELAAHPETGLIGRVVEALELPPVATAVRSGSPRGGGLGASSALAVGLIAVGEAVAGRPPSSPLERARLVRDLEAGLMKLPTGQQDQYPPLYGGVLEILYRPARVSVRRLDVDLEALAESLLVVYTGRTHFSGGKNWEVVRSRLDGEPESVRLFDGITAAAAELPEALEGGDLPEVGRLMSREWEHRRRLAEGIATPEIDELLELAAEQGAWGGKACGAGGGGCVAILCPPETRSRLSGLALGKDYTVLPASPVPHPLEVVASSVGSPS